jgi:hypothetical protein
MEEALKGIRGIITDAVTHAPLKARIDVLGISGTPVFSDSTAGDYHRLLIPGTYTLVVNAQGYSADTIRSVPVTDAPATRVDIALHQAATSVGAQRHDFPDQLSLLQNYPNPFNPRTNIGFRIQESGLVSLTVFDVLGREVVSLIHEEMNPGNHAIEFDASKLASGVYVYRLQSAGSVAVRKLVLMK